MLNFPVLYRQGSGGTDRVRLDFTESRDMTRQEFKEETDINVILNKFGVNSFAQRQPIYTEVDYTIDLQQALGILTTVQAGWDRLPDDIKARYPDWRTVVELMAAGTPPQELLDALKPKPEPATNDAATTQPAGETPTT